MIRGARPSIWPIAIGAVAGLLWSVGQPSQAQAPLGSDPALGARAGFVSALAEPQPVTATGNVTALTAQVGELQNFPHPALFGGANSSGWPFVGDRTVGQYPAGTPLNPDALAAYARFPFLILPVTPMSDIRPDIMPALRQRNASIKIFGYVMASTIWCSGGAENSYPANSYYRDYWLTVTGGSASCTPSSDRFLWLQNGAVASESPYDVGLNVNLALRVQQPDSSYRYIVAEQIAATMYQYAQAARGFNGIFIDVYCSTILWMEHGDTYRGPTDNTVAFDYARAGYGNNNADPASRTAFDVGWTAGHRRLAERLRELATADGRPDYPITGNCGQAPAALTPTVNGWMRENFPFQNAVGGVADFYSNMLTWPWGMMHQDLLLRAPQYNLVFTAAAASGGTSSDPVYEPYNATNQRRMRFGLGSTTLGNGYVAYTDSSNDPARGYWHEWWYDEFGVNTVGPQSSAGFGQSAAGAQYTGWLGQPLTPAYAQLADSYSATPDRLTTNQGFETSGATPSTVPGWTLINFQGAGNATLVRDTSTAALGGASLRADVVVPNPTYSYVVRAENGSFPISANTQYAVTFRAKASGSLPLTVTFGGSTIAVQTIMLDETWRQYQVQIRPTAAVTNSNLSMEFGRAAGTYWIDDVQVQTGTTAVYRRDFTKGIVLVNPAAAAQTVTLEQPYRKILGVTNPAFNDGSAVSQVTLAGTSTGGGIGDAIFLLIIDETAPAAITDLRSP